MFSFEISRNCRLPKVNLPYFDSLPGAKALRRIVEVEHPALDSLLKKVTLVRCNRFRPGVYIAIFQFQSPLGYPAQGGPVSCFMDDFGELQLAPLFVPFDWMDTIPWNPNNKRSSTPMISFDFGNKP